MAQINKKGWTQYIWKIIMAGGVLTLLSVVLPSAFFIESGAWLLLWYIGIMWGGDIYGEEVIGFIDDGMYMPIGVITTVLLIIALILMVISARNTRSEKRSKLNVGMSLVGGILAIIGPIVYYFYLDAVIPALFWDQYLPFVGVFLSIIAGILGIIGAIMVVSTTKSGSKSGEKQLSAGN